MMIQLAQQIEGAPLFGQWRGRIADVTDELVGSLLAIRNVSALVDSRQERGAPELRSYNGITGA